MTDRKLTTAELAILELIQTHYGPQNTADEVIFVRDSQACIWIKDSDGVAVMVANLTNLSRFMADGTIGGEKELLNNWLNIPVQ